MNAPVDRTTLNRCPADSYQEILDRDTREIPAVLREQRVPDLGSEPVAASRYFSPEFFAKEVKHVWRRTWQWACRAEEIPAPGDYVLYDIVGRSLIIARQEDGSIKAMHNSCLHRGRKLATLPGCKNEFRCPYHGLAWNVDGSFKENPIEWDFPQWQNKDVSLPEALVGEWGGFVFVNLDRDAPPLESILDPLPRHFERWRLEDCYKAVHIAKVIPANWKAVAEAFMESHHSLTTHPQLLPFLADVNSQYDILSDHVTRHISAQMVTSPLAGREYSQTEVLQAMLGRTTVEAAGDGAFIVPEDQTARAYAGDMMREAFSAEDGHDYTDVADAELMDALLHNVFPNMSFWGGFMPNLVYRWRPNGHDTESAIMDILLLKRVPKDGPRPKPAPVRMLGPDESFLSASDILGDLLAPVFEQDLSNLPHVQTGLRASGNGLVHLGVYSEMRIRHLHQMIDRYIAAGEVHGA